MKRLLALIFIVGLVMAANETNVSATKQFTPFWDAPNFNFTALMLWIAGFCLLLPFGWLVGRLQDINQRCKWMRLMTKKDYRLLKHKFQGSKTFFSRIVNVENSVITVNGKQWIITKDRMYLESNQKVGLNIKHIDKDPSYDDGCPVIFVDDENITPLIFKGDDTTVRPEELGSTYSGYLLNQMMKALSFVKNLKTLLMVLAFLAAGALIFSYLNHNDMVAQKTQLDYIQGVMNGSIQTNQTIHVGGSQGPQQVIKAGT